MPSRILEKYRKEYGHTMKAPRITKVVLNVGVGKIAKDAKALEKIEQDLAKITGQKPALRAAKKSIAGFKVREGTPSGYMVTLRGSRMYDFIDRLISVALPRSRDFQGIPESSFDAAGNLNIGIKEHNIFPEVSYESLKDIFGLEVTIVINAGSRKEGVVLLRFLGFPIRT
ncbi:MAG: 50S ribosomal protein L5 [Patescibacteria group bacterium]